MKKRKKDNRIKTLFDYVKKIFPECPTPWLVAKMAFSNKTCVGYDDYKTMERKVRLAVSAFIRHNLLEYDDLLEKGVTKEVARTLVDNERRKILRKWMGIKIEFC